MKQLAISVWCIIIIVFAFGGWGLLAFAILVAIDLLIIWKKPEWNEKIFGKGKPKL